MRNAIVAPRTLLRICYLAGALLTCLGLLVLLNAVILGDRVGNMNVPGSFENWTPIFSHVGVLVTAFGMAMVLLAMHHHLSGSQALPSGSGFEPLPLPVSTPPPQEPG
jgi:hypothetical protein